MVVISVKNVSITIAGRVILEDISFEMTQGEFAYLIGKTGSGKSSILRTLYADLPFEKGGVSVGSFFLKNLKKPQIAELRRKIGIVFQDYQLFADRNVAENLFFVMTATGWKDSKLINQRLEEVLEMVGLYGIEHKMPYQLSGGEQQRVAIARALINRPEILLADEPTGNLDPATSDEILNLFWKLNQQGTTVLMATHNHAFLKRQPARVLLCENSYVKDIPKEDVLRKL